MDGTVCQTFLFSFSHNTSIKLISRRGQSYYTASLTFLGWLTVWKRWINFVKNMMGVLKPLEEEMRMSESIFLPNGLAIISSFNLFFFSIHICHSLFFGLMRWKKRVEEWASLLYSINTQAMNGKVWKNLPAAFPQSAALHTPPSLTLSLPLSVWFIYQSVVGLTLCCTAGH